MPNLLGSVMANPVLDLNGMATETDIPDWIYAETLGTFGYDVADGIGCYGYLPSGKKVYIRRLQGYELSFGDHFRYL